VQGNTMSRWTDLMANDGEIKTQTYSTITDGLYPKKGWYKFYFDIKGKLNILTMLRTLLFYLLFALPLFAVAQSSDSSLKPGQTANTFSISNTNVPVSPALKPGGGTCDCALLE
jgi:hypothetical protein